MYTKECLERLRERIDLQEVISGHIELKRAGSAYKALCPFHEEKSPSFVIQSGDTHYHCFGCGAHGDAIQFLMTYLNLSFVDTVEMLAEKFGVPLEKTEREEKGLSKTSLKEACDSAAQFFHTFLLHTEEGKQALHYLYRRGITIDFIRRFQVGLAPENPTLLRKNIKSPDQVLIEAGLLTESKRIFFRDRITFPIRNAAGGVIGFSARKYKEETFGGKYINTSETALFKKSRVLFGLNECRRRMTKEHRVIIVEGQIDCLKLIEAGLNLTVAALGTAFTESHVLEIKKLGVREVFLLFDGDDAGKAAASKVGNLFQKTGLEVKVVLLPQGSDPDTFLNQFGVEKLIEKLKQAQEYLPFQIDFLSREFNLNSPAGKAEIVKSLKRQIESWDEPVMIHESLKRVATLVQVPEMSRNLYMMKNASVTFGKVDPNRVLELDLLRWLVLRPDFERTVKHYLLEKHFWDSGCRTLFKNYLEAEEKDLLALASDLSEPEIIDELMKKKVNQERAESHFIETIQKLLDREWMEQREEIKRKIHDGNLSEEEVLELAKQFDSLKQERPKAELCT